MNDVTYPPRGIVPHKNQVGELINNIITPIESDFDIFLCFNVNQTNESPIENKNNAPSFNAQIPEPNIPMKRAVEIASINEKP